MSNPLAPLPAKKPTTVGGRIAEAIRPMDVTVDQAVAIADAVHQPVERFLLGGVR